MSTDITDDSIDVLCKMMCQHFSGHRISLVFKACS